MLQFLLTKIGLSIILALIVIGGAVAFKFKTSDEKSDITSKVSLIAEKSVNNAQENGDLPTTDWEKLIRGASTSTTDQKVLDLTKNTLANEKELTATDRFAQTFFTKYVNLKQSGTSIDENTGIQLVNQLLAQDYGSAPEEKIYTENDIEVMTTFSLNDFKKYGNNLGDILQTPTPPGYEQELTLISRVSETKNTDDLQKLSLNIARYREIRDRLVALPVPNPLKNAHISMINSVSAMLEGIMGMTFIETDPVGATKMIARYQEGLDSVSLPLKQIASYLKKQNISFSSNESGYILMQ